MLQASPLSYSFQTCFEFWRGTGQPFFAFRYFQSRVIAAGFALDRHVGCCRRNPVRGCQAHLSKTILPDRRSKDFTKTASPLIVGNSPENKRVSRLFSVTTDSAPLSPARKLSLELCTSGLTAIRWPS